MTQKRYQMVFELEGLPRMTNPSGRTTGHWAVLKKESDAWKQRVVVTVAARLPARPLKKAELTLTRFSSSEPDADGLVSGFKHIIDGLVIAKVLENDKWKNIGMPNYRWEYAGRGYGKIRVQIEEVTDEA